LLKPFRVRIVGLDSYATLFDLVSFLAMYYISFNIVASYPDLGTGNPNTLILMMEA